ncbi:hypothetical protein IGI37_003205 [Enterococcus sp. AZ194]|uniref:homing endonuclease associated repeat-containing protein n=1 Tax=Enterococcus sp. AZ194 TaxID=2774629 RepID=UPI003F25C490
MSLSSVHKKRYTKSYFIEEIQRYYQRYQRIPCAREFRWKASAIKEFGTWNHLLIQAGLNPKNKQRTKKYTRSDLIEKVQLFEQVHKKSPRAVDVPWRTTAMNEFGSWNNLLMEAGLERRKPGPTKQYNETFFIEAVQLFEKTHGEPPTAKQFRWSSTAIRRFGTWNRLIEQAGFTPRESKAQEIKGDV